MFLEHLQKRFLFKIECVQTDNGQEFTKLLGNTENQTVWHTAQTHKALYTPRHNGKVERSHRKDNEYFYATHSFYSFEDFKQQLSVHNRNYNNFPMHPLNWKSPADYIKAFLYSGQVF